jgi:GT2 family glycosyltransferase/Flp pilus assembly protein TadD
MTFSAPPPFPHTFPERGPAGADPVVSIIIPVFNQIHYTSSSLKSLRENPPSASFEIIVVDDASTDATPEFLEEAAKKDARIRFLKNDSNRGFAVSCNKGAYAARGEYLLFLNNDVELAPGWFDPLQATLANDPSIGIVAPRLLFPDSTVQHCGKVWSDTDGPLSHPQHLYYGASADDVRTTRNRDFQMVTGACMLVRGKEFLSIGPFDERYLNGWEDDDLCYAYRSRGFRVHCRAETSITHFQGKTLSSEIEHLERYFRSVRKKRELLLLSGIPESSLPDLELEDIAGMAKDGLRSVDERYKKNRELFFSRWQDFIFRDDYIYHQSDEADDIITGRSLSNSPEQSVSIVVVTYNSADTILPCLRSLSRTIRARDEVIIVDNASRDRTVAVASEFISGDKRFTIFSNRTNRGFSSATNTGVKASKKPFIVLLNPDTIVSAGWLERLLFHFTPETAAVGPISNYVAGLQKMELYQPHPLAREMEIPRIAERFAAWNPGRSVDTRLLIGFCMIIRREVLLQTGLLDESLFLGNDDLELSWRLRANGFSLKIAADTFIHHIGQKSFATETSSKTDALVRDSANALYGKLISHYGAGNVPTPAELWGIDWFCPDNARFNPRTRLTDLLRPPGAPWIPSQDNEKQAPLTSIVILTLNQLELTRLCLDSIRKHTLPPHEIIFVDNGSSDGTPEFLRKEEASHHNIRLIENRENLGFSAGCNQGIRDSRGDLLLLLNNDVVVTPGWLEGMIECLGRTPGAGVVGPMTNNISGVQQAPETGYSNLDGLDGFAAEFREINRDIRRPTRRIVGFCMLFRRELVDRIGLLDESFGSGNFEDDDFCLRAAIEGFSSVIAADIFIHHFGSATFRGEGIDFGARMAANNRLFREKWSRPVEDRTLAEKILVLRTLEDAERMFHREESIPLEQLPLKNGFIEPASRARLCAGVSVLLIREKRYRDAEEVLSGVGESERDARWFTLGARAAFHQGRSGEAAALLERALTIDGRYPPALSLKGELAQLNGGEEEACGLFLKAMEADPGWGEPCTRLGLLDKAAANNAKALDLLERGFLLSPLGNGTASSYHGAIGTPSQAERGAKTVRRVLHFFQENRMLRNLLIDLLIQAGRDMEALEEIEILFAVCGPEKETLAKGLKLRAAAGPLQITPEREGSGQSVSLCMIMKNEEKNLPRFLQGVKPFADEILIADTGSGDSSREIASLYGARVTDFAWSDDFAAARNSVLDQARGEWILVLDPDEVISPMDLAPFKKLLDGDDSAAFEIVTRNYTIKANLTDWTANDGSYPGEEAGTGWTPSNKVRLFPNRPGIRFENPVHEMVENSIRALGIPVVKADIPVHHYGYLDEEALKKKRLRYYELGKKKLEECGGGAQALYELAIQSAELERYREAIELWQKVIARDKAIPEAYFNMGYAYLQMGRYREAMNATGQALALKPDYPEAVTNYALCELCAGEPEKGISLVEERLKAYGEQVHFLAFLAVAYSCLGDESRGMDLFSRLRKSGVDVIGFVNGTIRKLAGENRLELISKLLRIAVSSGNVNEDTGEILKGLSG